MTKNFASSRSSETAGAGSRGVGIALLLVTIVGWGINWPVIKILLAEWPPLFARGSSGMVAALGIALVAFWQGERLSLPPGTRVRMMVAALFNVTAWMGLATIAMKWLSVGEAAMIVYTMPIWAMLLAWPLKRVRPTVAGAVALVLGMSGIAVLLLGQAGGMQGTNLIGVICAFSAAILFAVSTIAVRPPAGVGPTVSTAWQLCLGSLPMLLAGVVLEQPDHYSLGTAALLAWIYMAVVAMGLCYVCWFAALRRLPPTLASLGTMLIPVIGTISAAAVLDEPFGPREALALALVIGGIALALRRG